VKHSLILLPILWLLALPVPLRADTTLPAEPLLRDLPPGLLLESCKEIPASQTQGIGQKLGGEIQRLTNSQLRVQGHLIQVNVVTARDEAAAQAIYDTLAKMKSPPFCLRRGLLVVEYVGQDIDAAFARKTSYELGLLEKPAHLRVRVSAQLATVDKADYMACTPLLNQFLALQHDGKPETAEQIEHLIDGFAFGHTLVLRHPQLGGASTRYAFQPEPLDTREQGASIAYRFGELEVRQGVPFVTATLEIDVDDTGFRASPAPAGSALTAATPFWPVDDEQIAVLAHRITADATTAEDRVNAILRWMSPGRNLRYAGEMGSRWGTRKVLQQGYGRCWDFSDCFITLARAVGVPARQVGGWLIGVGGHVWAEVHLGEGWQQVDPTGGGEIACGIYHVAYFVSEDGAMPIVYLDLPAIDVLAP